MKALVTGGTGNIGSELAALLAGDPRVTEVRAATRHPDGDAARLLAAMNPEVVRPVGFGAEDGDMATALDGVDVLCLVVPLVEDMVGWQRAVLDAATGVRRVVKVSVDAAGPDKPADALPGMHWAGEEMIREMGVERGVVRPTMFMQHFLFVTGLYERGDDTFYLPIADGKVAFLDCRDIALAVGHLATCPADALPADAVALTGPEALAGRDLAERLRLASGRDIAWEADMDAFKAHSKEVGSPEEVAAMYQSGADGSFAAVHTDAFTGLVGRRPRSFAKFAADHADHFRAGA